MTVLIYRTLGVAEFLTAVPAFRAVRQAFPGERIVLAAPPSLGPLVDMTAAIDRLAPTWELALPPRVRAPSVAIDLQDRGPESHRLLQSLHPGRLVAFGCPEAGVEGPTWTAAEHDVDRWVRLLRESGIEADPADLRLGPPRVGPHYRRATVVHPGASDPHRRWPEERFARVAADLTRRGHHVVVTGARSEHGVAERVTHRARLPSDRNLAARLDLDAMAALVHAARLVVCADTGAAHLASAFGTPSVVLFGPTSPARWGPPDVPWHRAIWHGSEGRRGRAGVEGSLASITVSEVLAATDDVLDTSDRSSA
jgi:ADP-heptose:LPS heptosyltransferase